MYNTSVILTETVLRINKIKQKEKEKWINKKKSG